MTFKNLMENSSLSMTELSQRLDIPYRTLQGWFYEERTPPQYILNLLKYYLDRETSGDLNNLQENISAQNKPDLNESKPSLNQSVPKKTEVLSTEPKDTVRIIKMFPEDTPEGQLPGYMEIAGPDGLVLTVNATPPMSAEKFQMILDELPF